MGEKILIVEDEESIRGFLKVNFKHNNYEVVEAESGEEGIEKAALEIPDVVILDIMLPGIDGLKVCEILRQSYPRMGIIMLTARDLDMDKINGLEYGADDYMVKPFNPTELVLRVKAILRRLDINHDNKQEFIIERYPFKIDLHAQTIYKNDKVLVLTPKEYMLMKLFIENPGRAFDRNELQNLIWGYDFFGDHKIIDVNVRRLRTKIEDDPSNPRYIETVWGTGYRWSNVKH